MSGYQDNERQLIYCPLLSCRSDDEPWVRCALNSCAWWDVLYKHCAVLGINHWLAGIAERSTLIMSEDDKSINIRVLK